MLNNSWIVCLRHLRHCFPRWLHSVTCSVSTTCCLFYQRCANRITARTFRFPQSSNSFNCIHWTCSHTPGCIHTTFPSVRPPCVCMRMPQKRPVRGSSFSGGSAMHRFFLCSAHLCTPACINTCVCVRRCAFVDSLPSLWGRRHFERFNLANTNNKCMLFKRN